MSHAETILGFIYDNDISQSVSSFKLLMWTFTAMCVSLIYGTLLTAGGKLMALNTISLIGVVLNIVLNLILIPVKGAEGAAMATLITQSLTAIAQGIVAHQINSIQLSLRTILSFVAYIGAMLLLIVVSKDQEYFLLIQFFSGIVFLFLFKLIDLKKLFLVLSSKD
jgi:O-antigen/teichoic acid export membrane protein